MAQIKGYTFTPRAIEAYDGWNNETKTLTPMLFEDGDGRYLHEALDNIALAAEAGVLDNFLWPQQLFADKDSYKWFISELQGYDDCYRVTDQWWTALSSLIGNVDEEAFVTASEIADKLNEVVCDDGLIKNFGKRAPAYKHSVEECIQAALEEIKNSFSHGAYFQALDNKIVRKIQDIGQFAQYYDLTLPKVGVEKSKSEGNALREPDPVKRKSVAKKIADKKAK
jgi:hypothetical protein